MSDIDVFTDSQQNNTTVFSPPATGFPAGRRDLRVQNAFLVTNSASIDIDLTDEFLGIISTGGYVSVMFPPIGSPYQTFSTVPSAIQLAYYLTEGASSVAMSLEVDLVNSSIPSLLTITLTLAQDANIVYTNSMNYDGSGDRITFQLGDVLTFNQIFFDFNLPRSILDNAFAIALTGVDNTIPCLAKNSLILMADATTKPIQDIVRGDWVASNSQMSQFHQVARLNSNPFTPCAGYDLVVFQTGSLDSRPDQPIPQQPLIMSANHALVWKGKRRPAKCFASLPMINRHSNSQKFQTKSTQSTNFSSTLTIGDFLPPDNDNGRLLYHLYDLQFEELGSYVANGVQVQSRSPRSDLTPLPLRLYFNPTLYRPETSSDDEEYEFSLDFTPVKEL